MTVREYQALPEFSVVLPLGGKGQLRVLAKDQLFLTFTDVTIRNVVYDGTFRVIRYSDGWGAARTDANRPGTGHNLYGPLFMFCTGDRTKEVTWAAKESFLSAMVAWSRDWVARYPDYLLRADRVNTNNDLVTLERQIREKELELNQLNLRLALLRDSMSAFEGR